MSKRIYIYDSTLRDGAQTFGVDFTTLDKFEIAKALDNFGIDYIEGGWPGANPTDDEFFANPPKMNQAKFTAFGMTRRATTSAANDPGLNSLINSGAKSVCMVGKAWDFHVDHALKISREENLKMISESIAYVKSKQIEPIFDAEHFFDGFKANKSYAIEVIKAAYESGSRWVVLCDTNGGSMPFEIEEIVLEIIQYIPGDYLGIHCHNDTENAVANSLAAVRAGVRQVQGTINGLGERCGNANLSAIIPNLMMKMGYDTGITYEKLKELTKLSRFLDERLNRSSNQYAAYVGASAFAHKGGLHVSAMAASSKSYEHIEPQQVGNQRNIVISDQAGRSNIIARLEKLGIKYSDDDVNKLVQEIKYKESQGYSFDSADASFELLVKKSLKMVPEFFNLQSFRVLDERRWDDRGNIIMMSEAIIKVKTGDKLVMTVAEGNGPVNALDKALRKALVRKYPSLKDIKLIDYKVRIVTPNKGTMAITRVLIETQDKSGERWITIGVSPNVIDASYNALFDSLVYKLSR